jgi:hypothetical protein
MSQVFFRFSARKGSETDAVAFRFVSFRSEAGAPFTKPIIETAKKCDLLNYPSSMHFTTIRSAISSTDNVNTQNS